MSPDFTDLPQRIPAGRSTKFTDKEDVPASPDPVANLDSSASPSAGLNAPPIFAQASSVGDSAAAVDELGFELYVNALADFLVAPNTRAPLTCSIEGSWGSGKSSFMVQLRNRLKTVAPNSRAIEFNAWKYDKQEELWAAFALNLTRSLRHQTHWSRRFLGDAKLYFSRIKSLSEALKLATFALAWLFILMGAGFIFFSFAQAGAEGRAAVVKQALQDLVSAKPTDKTDKSVTSSKPPAAPSLTAAAQAAPTQAQMADVHDIHYWLGQSTWAGAGIVVLALLWKLPDSFRKRLFSTQIEQYIDKPDYKGKAAFLDTFSQDFARTVRAYSRTHDSKIFVFIDDLDRCEAPKAADLMQAINLLIGDGNSLIFILGLDRAKVAAAIAFKFREIIPYLDPSLDLAHHPASIRGFGDNFLEKFIQLSFRLPISSNEAQAHRFIDSLIKDTASSATITAAPDPAKPTPKAAAAAAAESARRALRIESGAESQRIRDIVMMVREILEYSPRRIKTFLNAFRLALYIASAQGLLDIDSKTDEAEVTPERLGKFLVLTSRYPELRSILAEDPSLLYKIEQLALHGRTEDGGLSLDWLNKHGIRKLVTFGIVDKTLTREWQRQYSMEDFPTWKFDSVLPSVPPPADPRRSTASRAASSQNLGISDIPNLSNEAREQLSRAATAARGNAPSSSSASSRPQSVPRQAPAKAATPQPTNSKTGSNSKSAVRRPAPKKTSAT
jgi:KAP family P-loop domain